MYLTPPASPGLTLSNGWPQVFGGGRPRLPLSLHSKGAATTPAPGMRQEVLDVLSGTESHRAQREMQEILSEFPDSVLRNLKTHGLRINVTTGNAPRADASGAVAVGAYNLLTRNISFDESVLFSDFGRHMVLHEVTHAIDHMRGDRTRMLGQVPVLRALPVFARRAAESCRTEPLKELYREFQARANVEDAANFRRALQVRKGFDLPEHAKTMMNDGWGVRGVEYRARGANDEVAFDNDPGWIKRKVTGAVLGGIAIAAGSYAGVPMLMNAGMAMIGLQAGLLVKDVAVRKFAREHTSQVEMQQGETATVVQKGPLVRVTLPEQSAPKLSTWSAYAHRANMIEEYLAEGVSTYLESPSDRANLQRHDPKLHDFVEGYLRDEFAHS